MTAPGPASPARRDVGVGEAEPGLQLGTVQAEGLDLDEYPAGRRLGNWALAEDQRIGRRGDGVQDDGAHGRGERHRAEYLALAPARRSAKSHSSKMRVSAASWAAVDTERAKRSTVRDASSTSW